MAGSFGSYQSPKGRDHARAGEGMSDPDMELRSKRLKFLSRTRSRSSSPCSSSSPRTPGSWDSSPRGVGSSNADSHWGFSSPKVLSLSRSFGRRLGFKRSNSSSSSSSSGATASSPLTGSGSNSGMEGSPRARPEHRPMILEKLPSDEEERADYVTVVVGERSGRREKYIINKHLLTHHLFQTLVKCSEDMVGSIEFRSRALLFCDPALFLHLVEVVGADLALESA